MPNRAERRAQAKAGRRGVPSQYDQTQGRGRSGMIDEYQLQQKSQRLQDGTDGTEWKALRSSMSGIARAWKIKHLRSGPIGSRPLLKQ